MEELHEYTIEETAIYTVMARNRKEAEAIFLDSISVTPRVQTCEVPERDVFRSDGTDEEDEELEKEED